MIHIHIVEDNLQYAILIRSLCQTFFAKYYPYIQVHYWLYTQQFDKILNNIQEGETNIYFFDIALFNNKDGGINLAKQVREKDRRGYINFITAYPKFLYTIVKNKLQITNLIAKQENIYEELCNTLQFIMNDYVQQKDIISIKIAHEIFYLDSNNIIMIETEKNRKKSKIYATNGIYEVNQIIKELYEKLPYYFIRVHRSFIVNKHYIKKINTKEKKIQLVNGLECFYSPKYFKP